MASEVHFLTAVVWNILPEDAKYLTITTKKFNLSHRDKVFIT